MATLSDFSTIQLFGITYYLCYVDPSNSNPDAGQTPSTAINSISFGEMETLGATNYCYLIRRTSSDVNMQFKAGYTSVTSNFCIIGMPTDSDPLYNQIPVLAKESWGSDADIQPIVIPKIEINCQSLTSINIYNVQWLVEKTSDFSNSSLYIQDTYENQRCSVLIKKCKFACKGINLETITNYSDLLYSNQSIHIGEYFLTEIRLFSFICEDCRIEAVESAFIFNAQPQNLLVKNIQAFTTLNENSGRELLFYIENSSWSDVTGIPVAHIQDIEATVKYSRPYNAEHNPPGIIRVSSCRAFVNNISYHESEHPLLNQQATSLLKIREYSCILQLSNCFGGCEVSNINIQMPHWIGCHPIYTGSDSFENLVDLDIDNDSFGMYPVNIIDYHPESKITGINIGVGNGANLTKTSGTSLVINSGVISSTGDPEDVLSLTYGSSTTNVIGNGYTYKANSDAGGDNSEDGWALKIKTASGLAKVSDINVFTPYSRAVLLEGVSTINEIKGIVQLGGCCKINKISCQAKYNFIRNFNDNTTAFINEIVNGSDFFNSSSKPYAFYINDTTKLGYIFVGKSNVAVYNWVIPSQNKSDGQGQFIFSKNESGNYFYYDGLSLAQKSTEKRNNSSLQGSLKYRSTVIDGGTISEYSQIGYIPFPFKIVSATSTNKFLNFYLSSVNYSSTFNPNSVIIEAYKDDKLIGTSSDGYVQLASTDSEMWTILNSAPHTDYVYKIPIELVENSDLNIILKCYSSDANGYLLFDLLPDFSS